MTISKTTMFSEAQVVCDVLINSCFALFSPEKRSEENKQKNTFLTHSTNERGQEVIANFGMDRGEYSDKEGESCQSCHLFLGSHSPRLISYCFFSLRQ
jgi:hypothetical protein